MIYLMFAIKLFLLILLTDFVTGFVHFWIDQYGREEMPIVGKSVIHLNINHHKNPMDMTNRSYLQLTWSSWVLGFVILLLWFLSFGKLDWEIVFLVVYGSQGNIIHKWAHQTKSQNGSVITLLQKWKIIPNKHQHRHHHNAPFDTFFCVQTIFLNPVLEKIRFWDGLIWVLTKVGFPPATVGEERGGF